MDRYSRRNLEDLVVPSYQETSDSYPSPEMWSGGWNMNTSEEAAEKCFDYDVINNGFSGGLYSQMEMEIGTGEEKRLKANNGCFYNNSASTLHDFDGIQQMDDMFLSSILEDDDVPGNGGLRSFNELDNSNSPGTSSAYLDSFDGREVPLFNYNWETCQEGMPNTVEEEAQMNLYEEPSAEELVLQDLQRATEMMTDDTRKCFRDTFYRLAKNSQQKPESSNTNQQEFLEDQTRNEEKELETNSIDRAIANLTFNKMESNMRNLPPPKRLSSSVQG